MIEERDFGTAVVFPGDKTFAGVLVPMPISFRSVGG